MREVLMRGDVAAALRPTGGLAVFLVEVDEVDVGRHIELAATELAHADDPEVDALAPGIDRHAEAGVLLGLRRSEGAVQRHLGQLGHGARHVDHRGAGFDVEDGEPLERQLASHPQGRWQQAAALQQRIDQARDGLGAGQSRRQQGQLVGIAPADALHEARVVGLGHG